MQQETEETSKGKRPSPPSHAKILKYWFNIEHEALVGWEVYDNIAECSLGYPFCWACGVKKSKLSSLEKCHIIPFALGGSNEPSNYFLMCGDCHIAAPDTTIPTVFFKWLRSRDPHSVTLGNDLSGVLKPYEQYITSDMEFEIEEELRGLIRTAAGTHGGKMSRSTMLGLFDYALDKVISSRTSAPETLLAV